jgi:hypothetical protein
VLPVGMAADDAGRHQVGTATCIGGVGGRHKCLTNHCLQLLSEDNELRGCENYINSVHNGAAGLGTIVATGPAVNGAKPQICG